MVFGMEMCVEMDVAWSGVGGGDTEGGTSDPCWLIATSLCISRCVSLFIAGLGMMVVAVLGAACH